jgi:hypothetical protein
VVAALSIVIGIALVWLFRMSRIRILGDTRYAHRRAVLETMLFAGLAAVMVAAVSLSRPAKTWVLAVGFILLFGGYLFGLLRLNRRPTQRAAKVKQRPGEPT